jgi:hypothetical protein
MKINGLIHSHKFSPKITGYFYNITQVPQNQKRLKSQKQKMKHFGRDLSPKKGNDVKGMFHFSMFNTGTGGFL